jgi:predicted nucleotidyltransferase
MARTPKDTRTLAEKAADARNIVGSLIHEGYIPTPEAEAIHGQVARGEITSEEAIEIFRQRAIELDRRLSRAKSE